MPEGDTIFRTAATLRQALRGQVVLAVEAPAAKLRGRWPLGRLIDQTVVAVEARGKHLLIHFSNGLSLHSHMQMAGSWHLYRVGERWRLARHLARVVLRTAGYEAVCFRAPTVELLSPSELTSHPALVRLGPDLLAPDFDAAAAREGLKGRPDEAIASALLDQRALAGIGNVYKSEVLFICRQDPFRPVRDLADATLDRLIERARRLLRANVSTGAERASAYRVTTGVARPGAELWVYGRQDRPCRRCNTPIRMARQGGRSTYWCPACQAGGATKT
jgi:endonuclease-8